MSQPVKKGRDIKISCKKTIKKKTTVKVEDKRLPAKQKIKRKFTRIHPQYGTSKLEEKFAHEFLDKLGIPYIYQYEAKSIGRYYDFYCPEDNVLIEIDGDFYHAYNILYENMSPMQKRNNRVDKQKDHWAIINGIPLIRIWEHDINKHPEMVMEMLKEKFYTAKKNKEIQDKKKRRPKQC